MDILSTKICSRCKVKRNIDMFSPEPRNKDKHGSWCKICRAELARKHNKTYKKTKKGREVQKKYNQSKKGKKALRNRMLIRRYGINIDDYEEMKENQNDVCAICGNSETQKQKGKVIPLSVDHNHKTGKVRGLLCTKCNHKLGHLENIEFVLKAKLYLELNDD